VKPSVFASQAARILRRIEATTGQGSVARIAALKRDLLEFLETGVTSPGLREFAAAEYGLKGALRDLEAKAADGRLASAIYRSAVFGQTTKRALGASGAKATELQLARDIAKSLGRVLGESSLFVSDETPWLAELHAAEEKVTVVLDQRAAEDMLLPILEAYAVRPPRGRKGTEVYGICLGSHRKPHNTSQGKGMTTYVAVSRCAPQLRAKATSSSVWPSNRSLSIQLGAAADLFPQLDIVGDFHSHPWDHLDDMVASKGWEYSARDEAFNRAWVQPMRSMGYNPMIGFVVAIARKQRARSGGYFNKYGNHTHQVTVGSYQCVIAAYRIRGDGTYSDERISLYCTATNVW